MPEFVDFVRYLHVIGAVTLLGTGAGIAFFMVMANRTQNPTIIAHVAKSVVAADLVFTATAAVLQPITGVILANHYGWPLREGWVFVSLLLYVFVGLFWLPVVAIQMRLRVLADNAHKSANPLPKQYHSLYRVWFIFGFPAFLAVLAIFWLMLFKPDITIGI